MSQTNPRGRSDGWRSRTGRADTVGPRPGRLQRPALALKRYLWATGALARVVGRRSGSRRRGMGTVEFALASLLFLPITLGTIDLGRAVFEHSRLTNAVREGARYGKINPTDADEIEARVRDYAGGMTITAVASDPSDSPCDPGLCQVTVTANAQFDMVTGGFLSAILGGAIPSGFTMSSRATVEVE